MILVLLVKEIDKSGKLRDYDKKHTYNGKGAYCFYTNRYFFLLTLVSEKIYNIHIETEHYARCQEKYHKVRQTNHYISRIAHIAGEYICHSVKCKKHCRCDFHHYKNPLSLFRKESRYNKHEHHSHTRRTKCQHYVHLICSYQIKHRSFSPIMLCRYLRVISLTVRAAPGMFPFRPSQQYPQAFAALSPLRRHRQGACTP